MIRSLSAAVNKALKVNNTDEYDAKFTIEVDGKNWHCYTAAISYREITCYCKEGYASFDVNFYGGKDSAVLFDWTYEGEE